MIDDHFQQKGTLMNHLKLTRTIVILLTFCMMLLSLAHAEELTDEKWSFDFENIPIQDAFNEIQKQTGIEIFVHQNTSQPVMITYHNKNQSIMQIKRDMLRNVNHASSLNYANDGTLKSIDITIIGKGGENSNMIASDSNKQASGTNVEKKDLKPDLPKPQKMPASVLNNIKNNLERPPEPPKINGLTSPPMPPPSGLGPN
jgi:type II secretory pathway component GspD/PulD (secretin)